MRKNRQDRKNKGFSLVEILLAIVILALILTPVLQIFTTSMSISNRSKRLLGATEVAEMTLEVLNSKPMEGTDGIKEVFGANGSRVLLPALGSGTSFTVQSANVSASTSHAQFVSKLTYTTGAGVASRYCNYSVEGEDLRFALVNIVHNGYIYDVVVSMTPQKISASDEYYTYDVFLEVYGAEKNSEGYFEHYEDKLIEMNSAVVNKY